MIGISLGGFITNLAGAVDDQIDVLVSIMYANSVTSIALAYKHSFGKTLTNHILSNICSIALYGTEAKAEIEIREKQTFLSNVVTNLKHYNPTAL